MSRTLDEMLGVPSYGLKSHSAGESTILDVSRFRNRTEFPQLRSWTLNRELGGREISGNKLERDKNVENKEESLFGCNRDCSNVIVYLVSFVKFFLSFH